MTHLGFTMVIAGLVATDMDNRPGDNEAGLLGFLVVAAMAIACVFLYRSLRRHLRKINFEETPPTEDSEARSAGSEPS